MNKSKRPFIGVIVLVVAFFIILLLFAFITMKSLGEKEKWSGLEISKESIGIVEVNGVIMSSKKVIENLHRGEKHKQIKAIIVRVNSPGGAVGPSQEIYQEIRRINKTKPVYASFGTIATSGGYYIGAATKKIYANPGTMTGSIGVIMQFFDLSKMFEFLKVKPQVVKAGLFKDGGSTNRPLSDIEKMLMNKLVKGVHKQFIDDIVRVRKDVIKGNIEDHAQGQIFSGEQAKELGLVDELGGLWYAAREIHKELGLKGELKLEYIKKVRRKKLIEYLADVKSELAPLLQQGANESLIPYFLPSTNY